MVACLYLLWGRWKARQLNTVLRKRLAEFVDNNARWAAGCVKEAVTLGSEFYSSRPASFQLMVRSAHYVGGELREPVTVGQACVMRLKRNGNTVLVVVTAQHVLDSCGSRLQLHGPLGFLNFDVKNFSPLYGMDIGFMVLSEDHRVRLGAAVAKPTAFGSSLPVRVTGLGRQTTGLLSHGSAFGVVVYTGSTIRGFSGAPYFENSRVFGIHTSGCSAKMENYGVSAVVIEASICLALFGLGVQKEDSEEYEAERIARHMAKHGEGNMVQGDQFGEYYTYEFDDGTVWTIEASTRDLAYDKFNSMKGHKQKREHKVARGVNQSRTFPDAVEGGVGSQTPLWWTFDDDVQVESSTTPEVRLSEYARLFEKGMDIPAGLPRPGKALITKGSTRYRATWVSDAACETPSWWTYENNVQVELAVDKEGLPTRDASQVRVTCTTQTDPILVGGCAHGTQVDRPGMANILVQTEVTGDVRASGMKPCQAERLTKWGEQEEVQPQAVVSPVVEFESAAQTDHFLGASASDPMRIPSLEPENALFLKDLVRSLRPFLDSTSKPVSCGPVRTPAQPSDPSESKWTALDARLSDQDKLLTSLMKKLDAAQQQPEKPKKTKKKEPKIGAWTQTVNQLLGKLKEHGYDIDSLKSSEV